MNIEDRLKAKRRTTDEGCWEWVGNVHRSGYGRISYEGRYQYVHRVAYSVWTGALIAGLDVDHLCRNRICFNPAHLEQVDHRTNVLRSTANSAVTARTGICQRGHAMTPDNLYIRPDGTRKLCRKCIQLRDSRRVRGKALAELRAVVAEGKTRAPKPRMAPAPRVVTDLETVRKRADRTHVLGHQFRHPGMGGGTGCAVMIDEGILCGEARDHRMHRAPDEESAS